MPNTEAPKRGPRVSGYTIFDMLLFGGAFLLFARFCLGLERDAQGFLPFLRLSYASPTTVFIVAALSGAVLGGGALLLLLRLLGKKAARPSDAACKKSSGPGILESLADACKQLAGAKIVVETEKEREEKAREEARKAGKRNLREWLRQDKTRMAGTAAMIFITIYLAPRDLLMLMGTHAILLYLVQFVSFVGTFVLAIISWVEPT